jgi:hypothetical protein
MATIIASTFNIEASRRCRRRRQVSSKHTETRDKEKKEEKKEQYTIDNTHSMIQQDDKA